MAKQQLNLTKNKKSIYFWPLMVLYVMIISASLLYFTLSPAENKIKDFGNKLNQVYKFESKNNILNNIFYSFDKSLNKKNFYLWENGGLNLNSDFLNNKIFFSNSEKLTGQNCKFNNWFLWINEQENTNCYDIINDNYIENLYSYKIEKETEKLKTLFYSSDFTLSKNQINTNSKNIEITYQILNKNPTYKIENSYNFSKTIDISNYNNLIKTLKKSLTNLQNKTNQKKITNCINKGETKSKCIEKTYNNLFTKNYNNTNKKENYNYKIKISENQNYNKQNNNLAKLQTQSKTKSELKKYSTQNSDYNMLNFEIINLNSLTPEQTIFKFATITKNSLPPSPLSFELKNTKNSDKTIQVDIEKPSFDSLIENYVILYSPNDFTQNKELETKLNDNKIPNYITLENCKSAPTQDNTIYRYSKEYKLTVYTINKKSNLAKNNNKITLNKFTGYCSEKDGQITYQNFTKNKLFFFVYAIDKFNNYYAQDLKKSTKTITPTNTKTITPLLLFPYYSNSIEFKETKEDPNFKNLKKITNLDNPYNIFYTGNIQNNKNTIYIKTNGYNDPNFDHYDIIIKEKNQNNKNKFLNTQEIQNCLNQKTNDCIYLQGNEKFKNKNINTIFTSDTSFQISDKHSGKTIINIENNFLKNNHEYYILIIPIGKNGIIHNDTNYIDSNQNSHNILPIYLTIKDNSALHPTKSITEPNFYISNNDNKMYVDFTAKAPYSNSQISGLKLHFNKLTLNDEKQTTYENFFLIMEKNKPLSYINKEFTNIKSIKIDKIYPYKQNFNENLYDQIDPNLATYQIQKNFQ